MIRTAVRAAATLVAVCGMAAGQQTASSSPAPIEWTTAEDHKNMMEQLGIAALRPGPSGRSDAPNAANYDPAKANPFPELPDPLVLKNGKKCGDSLRS